MTVRKGRYLPILYEIGTLLSCFFCVWVNQDHNWFGEIKYIFELRESQNIFQKNIHLHISYINISRFKKTYDKSNTIRYPNTWACCPCNIRIPHIQTFVPWTFPQKPTPKTKSPFHPLPSTPPLWLKIHVQLKALPLHSMRRQRMRNQRSTGWSPPRRSSRPRQLQRHLMEIA